MACPFCALGCRDGVPQIEEVNRNWRFRQLVAHPDHSGGSTEAATFLNQTREYAIACLRSSSTDKPEAINCQRHGTPNNRVASSIYPTYHHHSTASASDDIFPPPPPPAAQTTNRHTMPTYPDPWDISEQVKTSTPGEFSQPPQPPPSPAVPQPGCPLQQGPNAHREAPSPNAISFGRGGRPVGERFPSALPSGV